MSTNKIVVVFVHGWSVTNTDTYGGLPQRLRTEASAVGIEIQTKEIHLGKYISFHDEVRVTDIARAFDAALKKQLFDVLATGTRFVCITHSTGGPVIREWWYKYFALKPNSGTCPMSHLIMLAPANHGSALAQLGKGRLGRMKSWFGGVEPGQRVLDWLELGSAKAWELNMAWITSDGSQIKANGIFPFVLTGQYIDRSFYDSLNSYTGEMGSDGVVRVAAANLNGRYIRLVQVPPVKEADAKSGLSATELFVEEYKESPKSALRIIGNKSHSGGDMGIMRSVHKTPRDKKSRETVNAIISCIQVKSKPDYRTLCGRFSQETDVIQENERLETEKNFLRTERHFFHDQFSMVIFRVRDHKGFPVPDFDLVLTAGEDNDPNHLPTGFFADRQRNKLNPEVITYYFNYDMMIGSGEIKDDKDKVIRSASKGVEMLGMKVIPRPQKGFVHYLPCEIRASKKLLGNALHPNGTTLIDIVLRRAVHANVFELEVLKDGGGGSFKKSKPSDDLVQ